MLSTYVVNNNFYKSCRGLKYSLYVIISLFFHVSMSNTRKWESLGQWAIHVKLDKPLEMPVEQEKGDFYVDH